MNNNNNTVLFDLGSYYSHIGTRADDTPFYSFYTRTIEGKDALEIVKDNLNIIRRQSEPSFCKIFEFLDDKFSKQDFWSKNFAFSYENFHGLKNW